LKELNLAELEQCCGVGVVISPAQVEEAVEAEITKVNEEILAKRYRFNAGLLMATVRSGD
jgi:glutaminyl-tRNA synthetase